MSEKGPRGNHSSFEEWRRQRQEEEERERRKPKKRRRAKGHANAKAEGVISRAQARRRKDPKDSPSGVAIVQLKPNDWKILRDLKIKSLIQEPIAFEDYEKGMTRYESRTEAEWRRDLDEESSGKVTVFAVDGRNYIGMVTAILDPKAESAQIQHMYVDENRRGRGIGKALLTSLLREIQERNVGDARLTVLETQIPARNLYESSGFRPVVTVDTWRGGKQFKDTLMTVKL